jgi:hypothetical protein
MLDNIKILKIKRYNLILLFILISPGIHLYLSRYGVRLEQLIILGFMVSILPILIIQKPEIFKKDLIIIMSFLWYLPITLIINTDIVASLGSILGFLRFIGFGIIGYLIISKSYHYEKLIKFTFKISLVYLFISYLQHYNIFNIGNFFFTYYNGSGYTGLYNYIKIPTTTFGIAEFTARFLVFAYIFTFLLYKQTKFLKSFHLLVLIGLFIFMFMFSESRGTEIAIFYISLILIFTKNKKFTFNISFILLLLSIVLIIIMYQYLVSSDTGLDKNLLYRLEKTWLNPLIDMSSSYITLFFGMGLHMPYGDGSFTARLGQSGILGLITFYLPIIYILIKIKNLQENNFYLNVFFFSTIILLVSNVTYQAFDTGKQADIYWFILGATYKYMYLKRKNSHETIHSIS